MQPDGRSGTVSGLCDMAMAQAPTGRRAISFRFGEFELRLDSGELFRSGAAVKLQPRPAKVLEILAGQAGEVVSRDAIRRAVWGGDTYVDFDLALNFSILQIRRALGDSAAQPRFVATLPRRGYRFLARVEVVDCDAAAPMSAAVPAPRLPTARWRSPLTAAGGLALVLSVLLPIAVILVPRLVRPLSPGIVAPAGGSPGQERYLEGQYLAALGETAQAKGRFEEAALLDPRSAPAFASLGQVILGTGKPARDVLASAEAAEGRALALDPSNFVAAVVRGQRLFQYDYDWRGAEEEFRRAVRLEGRSAQGHFGLARVLAAQGRHDEALAELSRAEALEPERMIAMNPGWFYYLARRYDQAIERTRQTIALALAAKHAAASPAPVLQRVYWTQLLAALAKGDVQVAQTAAQDEARAMALPVPASLIDFWARMEQGTDRADPASFGFAVVAAIELGQVDHALDLLRQQCRERSGFEIPFLQVDPAYDRLRGQPRFAALLRCAKLAS